MEEKLPEVFVTTNPCMYLHVPTSFLTFLPSFLPSVLCQNKKENV